MSTTESERHELYEIAKHTGGDRFAELMMKSIPSDPGNLATKDDLALLGSDLRAEMSELRGDLRTEMAELRGELRSEMSELRGDMAELRADMAGLRGDMAGLRGEVQSDITGLRGDLRTEIRDLTINQTRTLMLGLVGSITALTVTELLVGGFG